MENLDLKVFRLGYFNYLVAIGVDQFNLMVGVDMIGQNSVLYCTILRVHIGVRGCLDISLY